MASGAHSAIASPNLRYRRLRSGDIGGLVRYRNNAKFLRLYPTETFGDAEADAYLTPLLRWAEEHPPRRFAFAVEPKEEDLLIGVCSLRMAAGESH